MSIKNDFFTWGWFPVINLLLPYLALYLLYPTPMLLPHVDYIIEIAMRRLPYGRINRHVGATPERNYVTFDQNAPRVPLPYPASTLTYLPQA